MKNTLSILLSLMLVLCLVACKGNKEKRKLPNEDISKNVSVFATLPACMEMYRLLDANPDVDYSGIISKAVFAASADSTLKAFQTGMWFADAILAAKAGNNAILNDFQKALANPAGKDESSFRNRVSELKEIIADNDRQMTEMALVHLMGDIESDLWRKGDYSAYTMVVTGAWAQTTNRLATLIKTRYPGAAGAILGHAQSWQSIESNLKLLAVKPLASSRGFTAAMALCNEMTDLTAASGNNESTSDQVDTVITITGNFLSLVR